MYHVLQLTYNQPIDVVDRVRPAHLEWLDAEIAAGNILISGRNEAGTGGVLITGDISAENAQALIAADPYTAAGGPNTPDRFQRGSQSRHNPVSDKSIS